MTARTPIDPADIRTGDLIRWERGEGSPTQTFEAAEFRATFDGDGKRNWDGQHYLLDRPAPAVDLPTEPTLGWITGYGYRNLDFWRYRDGADKAGEGAWAGNDPALKPYGYGIKGITDWVPATAVPTSALDELRTIASSDAFCVDGFSRSVRAFLAAVDAANGTAS